MKRVTTEFFLEAMWRSDTAFRRVVNMAPFPTARLAKAAIPGFVAGCTAERPRMVRVARQQTTTESIHTVRVEAR